MEDLDKDALRGMMDRVARFRKITKQANVPCAPPRDVVDDLYALGEWPFPPLEGISQMPVVRPDGSVLTVAGYDDITRLLYVPTGLRVPTIPAEPTEEERAKALAVLDDLLRDFPLADDPDYANALAAMLTPVLRPMIRGCTPMGVVSKPQPGVGATLLSNVIATIATGRPGATLAAPRDDDAWRKRITSLLYDGYTIIIIDNVEGRLYAPSLGAVLTSELWGDRLLGKTKMLTLPQRASWFATGNNVQLGGDLPRRCYWVTMENEEARPWLRTGFTHPQLLEWVQDHRGTIIASIITLMRAWVIAGRPKGDAPVLGSFQDWARTIGGILTHAGVEGFLDNFEKMYDLADSELLQWQWFLEQWQTHWGDQALTTGEIRARLTEKVDDKPTDTAEAIREALPDNLADVGTKGWTRSLGWQLRKRNRARFPNGLRVESAWKTQKKCVWRVVGKLIPQEPRTEPIPGFE